MIRFLRYLRLQRPFHPLRLWWWFTVDLDVQRWRWQRARWPVHGDPRHPLSRKTVDDLNEFDRQHGIWR